MRVFSLLGWALLIGALLAAVGEIAARANVGAQGIYFTSEELWLALAPDSYGGARALIGEALSPAVWQALAATLLKLPAWLLLGLPGGLLAWLARAKPEDADDFDPDAPFLLDELARRAREEGFGEGDDRLPEDQGPVIVDAARRAATEPPLFLPGDDAIERGAQEANRESDSAVEFPPGKS